MTEKKHRPTKAMLWGMFMMTRGSEFWEDVVHENTHHALVRNGLIEPRLNWNNRAVLTAKGEEAMKGIKKVYRRRKNRGPIWSPWIYDITYEEEGK